MLKLKLEDVIDINRARLDDTAAVYHALDGIRKSLMRDAYSQRIGSREFDVLTDAAFQIWLVMINCNALASDIISEMEGRA